MAPTRCPHCQAALKEPVVFCGACGRRVAAWQPPADERGDRSAEARRIEGGVKDDPAATMKIASEEASALGDDGDDPSASMARALRPAGPRLIKITSLVLALAITTAGLTATVLKSLHPSPSRPAVMVNLDQPVFRYEAPAPDDAGGALRGRRRRRTGVQAAGAVGNSPSIAMKQGDGTVAGAAPAAPAGPAPAAAPTVEQAPPASAETAREEKREAPKQEAKEAAREAPSAAPGPGPIEMPGGLEEESAPPSPEEMREEEQARSVADGIRFVLRAHRPQVVACYERAFKDERSSPGGRVTVEFTIDASGKARHVRTSLNSTNKEMLGRCLEQRIAEWEFPKPPSGDFPTSYPFVFSAGS